MMVCSSIREPVQYKLQVCNTLQSEKEKTEKVPVVAQPVAGPLSLLGIIDIPSTTASSKLSHLYSPTFSHLYKLPFRLK